MTLTARDHILAAQAELDAALELLPPDPPTPPVVVPGFWPVANATVDPQGPQKLSAAYANGGTFYYSAGVATAQTVAGAAYTVVTQEKDSAGNTVTVQALPLPATTKAGCTNDGLLVGLAPDGTRYSFAGSTQVVNGKVTSCFGATVTAAGLFTETPPGSTSAGRLPFGYITPAQVAANTPSKDGALTFSTANVGHGAAVYPANTTATNFPGNGLGLPVGSWVGLKTLIGCPAKTQLELYHSERLFVYGAFLRDVGSTFMWYLTDQTNQGGQVADWAAVGVTFTSATPAGVPYALPVSQAYASWLRANLQLFNPPAH